MRDYTVTHQGEMLIDPHGEPMCRAHYRRCYKGSWDDRSGTFLSKELHRKHFEHRMERARRLLAADPTCSGRKHRVSFLQSHGYRQKDAVNILTRLGYRAWERL